MKTTPRYPESEHELETADSTRAAEGDVVAPDDGLFRELIENSEQVFWLVSLDLGRLIYVSPSFEGVWGFRPERALADYGACLECMDAQTRSRVLALAEEHLAGGRSDIEYRITRPDGEERVLRDRGFPVRDADGRIYRIAGVTDDVTEQRRTEMALHQARARLEAVLESSPVAIIALDRKMDVLLWNSAAEKLFGWSAAEVLGRPYPVLTVGDTRTSTAKLCAGGFAGEFHEALEAQRLARDGTVLDVEIWTAPLRGRDGSVDAVIGLVADIRDRRHLEEQFRHAQKMEAVGRVAGGVAHDFNNILTVIGGRASLLLQSIPDHDPIREDLDEIASSVERASGLTRQLLAFSRKQVLETRVLDLRQVLHHAGRMVSRVIGEDVRLEVNASDVWSVRADPGQVEQVLLNLVVNARDAMPAGGTLTITVSNASVSSDADVPPGEYVELVVSDTGMGIPAEHIAHIFEPFYTSKSAGKGTGLGLSTVYGIVSQSGGHIRVSSTVGAGTAFSIYLPRVHASPDVQAVSKRHDSLGGTETLLLVEDDAGVRTLMQRLLRRKGYDVLTAANGGEAMLIARRHPGRIALLITDVVMPEMNGPAVADYFRDAGHDMPVLFVSGYPADLVAEHGIHDGALNYLSKPFSTDGLAAKVREVLDGSFVPHM